MRGREEDPISIVMDSREETSWAFKGVDGVNTVTSKKKKQQQVNTNLYYND